MQQVDDHYHSSAADSAAPFASSSSSSSSIAAISSPAPAPTSPQSSNWPPFISLGSLPKATPTVPADRAILTPPVQQQESILAALSQSAAVQAATDDDDEEMLDEVAINAAKSTDGSQERGNGWSLLKPDSRSATASGSAIRGRSLTARPLDGISGIRDTSSESPATSLARKAADSTLESKSGSRSITPARSVVDCHALSHKVKDTHDFGDHDSNQEDESMSRPQSAHRSRGPSGSFAVGISPSLPAEGAGLRGTDHDKLVVEQEAEEDAAKGAVLRSRDPSISGPSDGDAKFVDPLTLPPARKLCIRHQRMADEGTVGKLQRSIESLPLADQTAVNSVWSIFSFSSHARRALILQGILGMCCFSQLSMLSSELALAIRIDPFSLFPREVSLKVLGHLDAISLGKAAQVSKSWRALADDDMLWRNMCEQHIERKCEKCGWGLPLLSEKKRRFRAPIAAGTPESRQLTFNAADSKPPSADTTGTGNLKRSITAAANAAALEKQSRTANNSRSSSPMPGIEASRSGQDTEVGVDGHANKRQRTSSSTSSATEAVKAVAKGKAAELAAPAPVTRPWKTVYCERLAIERNWRRGRYTVKTLAGHTDGIMCLQFNESLACPSFPVAITGSYDRSARVWNMDTGEELRVLRGHTRGVRCLQFDEAKLITGSMDRTLKIWNWRTGALIRTLEGHTEGIVCLNFNSHLLASGSADSNIKIWNFKTGQCHTLRGHTDWVNSVTLWSGKASSRGDSDGAENTFLFSASDDGTIRLWDLAEKECLMVFTGHVGQCQGLSLVHMPEEVVETLAKGGSVGPNGANVGPQQQQQQQQQSAQQQYQSDDVFANASAGEGSTSTRDEATYFMPPADASAQATPNGDSRVQSCGYNPPAPPGGRSANTGTAPAIPDHFYSRPASGQHRTHLRQLNNYSRRKIDPALLKLQDRLHAAGLVDALPIDAEMGDLEWGAARRRHIRVSQAGGGSSPPSQHQRVSPGGTANSSSPSGGSHEKMRPMLFSCSLDNTIKIWDVRTGVCIRTLFGHMAGLWALSTDRLRLATASHDATLKVWELATGKHLFSICEHRGPVTCVQIGDDKVLSGSDDGRVNVYSFAAASSNSPSTTA